MKNKYFDRTKKEIDLLKDYEKDERLSYLQLSEYEQDLLNKQINEAREKKDWQRIEKLDKRWAILASPLRYENIDRKTSFDKHWEKVEKKEARKFERDTDKGL